MLEFGNKEWRNLQQQVGKNKEDIESLKTGIKISYWVATTTDLAPLMVEANVGKYIIVGDDTLYTITHRANEGLIAISLGQYPRKGDTGATGPQGIQGITGPTGHSIYGVASELPSASSYNEGDFYLLSDGQLFKKITGVWVRQCSIKGPQGLPGENDEVEANPTGTATGGNLTKVKIDGVIYNIPGLTDEDRLLLNNLEEYLVIEDDGSFTFGHDIYADGSVEAGTDVTVGRNLYVDDLSKIQNTNGDEIVNEALALKADAATTYTKIETNTLLLNKVSIINAPSGTTLSDDEIAKIIDGIFINGTWEISGTTLINPVFLPASQSGTNYRGSVLSQDSYGNTIIDTYVITNKIISLGGTRNFVIQHLGYVNGKFFPNYPSSTGTFVLKCVNGTLTWVAE